jgi:porphobilinogen synthase
LEQAWEDVGVITKVEALREMIDGGASRRVATEREVAISPKDLAQPLDVDLDLSNEEVEAVPGLPGYLRRGLGEALSFLQRLEKTGLASVVVRLAARPRGENLGAHRNVVERWVDALQRIREEFPPGRLDIIVDPFSVALRRDGTWGIRDEQGRIDTGATLELLDHVARSVGGAGASGLLTLGRINREVEVTKAALEEEGLATRVHSFSQNSETSTAYVYLDADKAVTDTGQKILPGNATEMDLRALIDVWDGTDVSVVKPLENYHSMASLRLLLDDAVARETFLCSTEVERLAALSPFLSEKVGRMLSDRERLAERCEGARIGAYCVSGTTFLISLLARERGIGMARARLEEMWVNVAAASKGRADKIVDRNAFAYLSGSLLAAPPEEAPKGEAVPG